MCVVIDTNVVSVVFDTTNVNHSDFKPVLESLFDPRKKSKLVYGGNKYLNEVNHFKKHLNIIAELNRRGKTKKLNNEIVDAKSDEIKQELDSRGFDTINDDRYNDYHILAMILIGEAKVVSTKDFRSIPLLRTRRYYLHQNHIPSFYTSIRNQNLFINPKYFAGCCSN